MRVTAETIEEQRTYLLAHADRYVALINAARERLGEHFDQHVAPVDRDGVEHVLTDIFADPATAANVTGLVLILRELDVVGDYPGFIVDEMLGRQLAATIAGGQPAATLAEATFHFIDITHHESDYAGRDDLDAAVAAGVQTRLPGWGWQERPAPFE